MRQLVNAYRTDRNVRTARKIKAYERRHPFCMLALTLEESDLVAAAIHHAEQGA